MKIDKDVLKVLNESDDSIDKKLKQCQVNLINQLKYFKKTKMLAKVLGCKYLSDADQLLQDCLNKCKDDIEIGISKAINMLINIDEEFTSTKIKVILDSNNTFDKLESNKNQDMHFASGRLENFRQAITFDFYINNKKDNYKIECHGNDKIESEYNSLNNNEMYSSLIKSVLIKKIVLSEEQLKERLANVRKFIEQLAKQFKCGFEEKFYSQITHKIKTGTPEYTFRFDNGVMINYDPEYPEPEFEFDNDNKVTKAISVSGREFTL